MSIENDSLPSSACIGGGGGGGDDSDNNNIIIINNNNNNNSGKRGTAPSVHDSDGTWGSKGRFQGKQKVDDAAQEYGKYSDDADGDMVSQVDSESNDSTFTRIMQALYPEDLKRMTSEYHPSIIKHVERMLAGSADSGTGKYKNMCMALLCRAPYDYHLMLLALLYQHEITKGAALEPRKGGVADIEMLRFPAHVTEQLRAANALGVYFTGTRTHTHTHTHTRIHTRIRTHRQTHTRTDR